MRVLLSLEKKLKVALTEYREVPTLSNSNIRVWIIDTRIFNTPQIGGGVGARVFKKKILTDEETPLKLLTNIDKNTPSNWVKDTAFILGDSGLSGTSESSSKLLVGLEAGDDPYNYVFELDYVVSDKVEVISEARLNEFSSFSVGELNFTFEEE